MQKVTENYLSKVTRYFYFVTERHWAQLPSNGKIRPRQRL